MPCPTCRRLPRSRRLLPPPDPDASASFRAARQGRPAFRLPRNFAASTAGAPGNPATAPPASSGRQGIAQRRCESRSCPAGSRNAAPGAAAALRARAIAARAPQQRCALAQSQPGSRSSVARPRNRSPAVAAGLRVRATAARQSQQRYASAQPRPGRRSRLARLRNGVRGRRRSFCAPACSSRSGLITRRPEGFRGTGAGRAGRLAGRQGFEPRFYGPEPHVLPLDDLPPGTGILARTSRAVKNR
jgi:hypothetical protein